MKSQKSQYFKILDDEEKPTRWQSHHTITLDYTSPDIEKNICNLTRKISQTIPKHCVNFPYRSIKVTKLFSGSAEAEIDKPEKSNVVYEYGSLALRVQILNIWKMRNLIWLVDLFLIWPMKSAYSAIKGLDCEIGRFHWSGWERINKSNAQISHFSNI